MLSWFHPSHWTIAESSLGPSWLVLIQVLRCPQIGIPEAKSDPGTPLLKICHGFFQTLELICFSIENFYVHCSSPPRLSCLTPHRLPTADLVSILWCTLYSFCRIPAWSSTGKMLAWPVWCRGLSLSSQPSVLSLMTLRVDCNFLIQELLIVSAF